jgi:hypothetical protein
VFTSQPHLVVLAVDGNVIQMTLLELSDSVFDGGHTLAWGSHLLGGVVGVASGTIPVSLERLGVEGRLNVSRGSQKKIKLNRTHPDSPLFTDTEEQEPGHPEVVTKLDTETWADLELPLGRHDLGVDTRDVDTSVETGSLKVSGC